MFKQTTTGRQKCGWVQTLQSLQFHWNRFVQTLPSNIPHQRHTTSGPYTSRGGALNQRPHTCTNIITYKLVHNCHICDGRNVGGVRSPDKHVLQLSSTSDRQGGDTVTGMTEMQNFSPFLPPPIQIPHQIYILPQNGVMSWPIKQ